MIKYRTNQSKSLLSLLIGLLVSRGDDLADRSELSDLTESLTESLMESLFDSLFVGGVSDLGGGLGDLLGLGLDVEADRLDEKFGLFLLL